MNSDDIIHRVRANVFARDAEWRLSGDRLAWRATSANATPESGIISLDQIESIRLTREPTRGGTRMFCRLRTRHGATAIIASAHHAGMFSAEDRSASYRALVAALVSRTAQVNPRARFLTGATPQVWWGVVLGLACLFGALGATFVMAGRELFTTRLLLGLGLVALGAPNLVRWLKANHPGTFDPGAPPI
jgi:hypothetical protein